MGLPFSPPVTSYATLSHLQLFYVVLIGIIIFLNDDCNSVNATLDKIKQSTKQYATSNVAIEKQLPLIPHFSI